MSIADEFNTYKARVLANPQAPIIDVPDSYGYTFRYHMLGEKTFGAVMDRQGRFSHFIKHVTFN